MEKTDSVRKKKTEKGVKEAVFLTQLMKKINKSMTLDNSCAIVAITSSAVIISSVIAVSVQGNENQKFHVQQIEGVERLSPSSPFGVLSLLFAQCGLRSRLFSESEDA